MGIISRKSSVCVNVLKKKKNTGKHKLLDMFSEVFAVVICLVYVFGFNISSFVFPFQWKCVNTELKVGDLIFKY